MVDYYTCPSSQSIFVQGNELTSIITKDMNDTKGHHDFRIIVAPCQQIADDASKCEAVDKIEKKLNSFYIDMSILS